MKLIFRFYLYTLPPIIIGVAGLLYFNWILFKNRLDEFTQQAIASNIREMSLIADTPAGETNSQKRESLLG